MLNIHSPSCDEIGCVGSVPHSVHKKRIPTWDFSAVRPLAGKKLYIRDLCADLQVR